MSRQYKLFVGQKIREIRQEAGLTQAEFAQRLGISNSYFNQIENNQRHVTAAVMLALAADFGVDIARLSGDDGERLLADLNEVLADPVFAGQKPSLHEIKLVTQNAPGFVHALMAMHSGLKKAGEQLAELDSSIVSGGGNVAPTAYEEVRDFFHYQDNYIDALDLAAEALADAVETLGGNPVERFKAHLWKAHGVTVMFERAATDPLMMRRYDPAARQLRLNATTPTATQAFQLGFQIALLEQRAVIDEIIAAAGFRTEEAADICVIGLANYFAGALLLPYGAFAGTARSVRNDIDALASMFGASLEQVAHRLSTLQRPGKKGVPFFFAKLDQAGNITKRHSATKLQFARFGAACPLWNAHKAFETPNRILRQLAETPDGIRYISIAIEAPDRPGSYGAPVRRFALAMGCEVKHADQFVYADDLDVHNPDLFEPIGVSCRICERPDCIQRAVPPSHAHLHIDPDNRMLLPYRLS